MTVRASWMPEGGAPSAPLLRRDGAWDEEGDPGEREERAFDRRVGPHLADMAERLSAIETRTRP